MKFRLKFIFLVISFLFSACDSSLEKFFEPSPFEVSNGPLTSAEIEYFTSELKESPDDEAEKCIVEEAKLRASKVGDPETLDPATVEILPVNRWRHLDKHGKRLILTQVILNQAILHCSFGKFRSGL